MALFTLHCRERNDTRQKVRMAADAGCKFRRTEFKAKRTGLAAISRLPAVLGWADLRKHPYLVTARDRGHLIRMPRQQKTQAPKPCPVCGVAMQVAAAEESLLFRCERCDLAMEFRTTSHRANAGGHIVRSREPQDAAQGSAVPNVASKT
jgi:hypothetical protein